MFTINTSIEGCQKPLQDWFIIVNEQKCLCNKSFTLKISPIIQDFYNNNKNEDTFFSTEIRDDQILSDPMENSEGSLNSICKMISNFFCGEEIICQEDNFEILYLIGKHFRIQEIINTIEEYQKFMKMISSHLKERIEFNEMIELEKMLLFEINETNIETKVKEYESLIKKIPIDCFIHFVINICTKNYNIIKINTNEFVIEIIKNVDKIVPETLPRFLSIVFHKFVFYNSIFTNDIDKFNKKEINSLIHQVLIDGLTKILKETIRFNQSGVIIPKKLKKYINREGNFICLFNKTSKSVRKVKDQFFNFILSIKNDDIDSFQKIIVSSQIDINNNINNSITKQLSIISGDGECSLIELSALLGSIKCFTYLYNKQVKFMKNRLSYFAVAGGNSEIIHICEREDCVFNEKTLDISIEYHRHQITKWLVDTKNIIINERNLRNSIIYYNIKTIRYLIKKGINIDKMLLYICESNNIILYNWLGILIKNYEKKNFYQDNNKTALHIACEQNNNEIAKLLILRENIAINSKSDVINWEKQKYLLCDKTHFKSL